MSLTVIELNDLALSVTRDGVTLATSPGVALLEATQVTTGDAALARAQARPREVYSHYWQQLNELPLPRACGLVRHHADLAWHQLGALLDAAGRPARAVLAVPGHYDEAQLALLLGLCAAQRLGVDALVDAAVAAVAGCAPGGHYVVLDLHRHHCVLTTVEVDAEVTRIAVDDLPQAGYARVEAAAAELAAGALLAQARFDAQHEADSAQRLHEALPGWLAAACSAPEVSLALEFRGRRHVARLASREFVAVTEMVLRGVFDRLPPDTRVLLGPALAALPGALELLAPARVLPVTACARGIGSAHLATQACGAAAPYLTTLPACAAPSLGFAGDAAARAPRRPLPSHVLCGAEARALDARPLYLHADGGVSRAARGAAAALSLAGGGALLRGEGIEVRVNGVSVGASALVQAGDHITLGAGRALYIPIAVSDERAP